MNQDKIWHHVQNDTPEAFAGAAGRLSFLLSRIRKSRHAGSKLLNVGIGDGQFERMALASEFEVYALDPDEDSIRRLNDSLRLNGRAKAGRLEQIPFESGLFDAVVVSEVLEHLSPEQAHTALAEIERVLAPNGRIFGTVPARENLRDLLIICPHCGEQFHRWGHQQSFERDSLSRLLTSRFDLIELKEKYLDSWAHLNLKGKVLSAARRTLTAIGVQGSGASFYFSARKRNRSQ